MRKLTSEEKERLQAMIDQQNRDQKRRRPVYLERKVRRGVAEQAAERASKSGFHPIIQNPPLESTSHRTKYHPTSRSKAKLRSMQLTEEEKEELKDKVWGKIRDRHKSS